MTRCQGPNKVHGVAVLDRVRELLDYRAPWHRSLWSVGIILELREILEYAARDSGRNAFAIGEEPFTQLRRNAAKRVERDAGIGDKQLRRRICNLLNEKKFLQYQYHCLEYLIPEAQEGYLNRLAEAARTGQESQERIARHLAETLLDRGINPDKIHHWLTSYKTQMRNLKDDQANAEQAAKFILEAETLAKGAEIQLDIAVPFRDNLVARSLLPQGVIRLNQSQAYEWLRDNCPGGEASSPTSNDWSSFLVISIRCMDEWNALEKARELIARVQAQISLSPNRPRFEPIPHAWIAGKGEPFPLPEHRQNVRVPSLGNPDIVGSIADHAASSQIIDALVLLSSMKSGTTGASLTSGWAAMEGLLGEGGANYLVASRMANILAASLVRAELTWLVNIGFVDPKLMRQLTGSASRKVGILEERLRYEKDSKGYKHAVCENLTDQLAVERLRKLIRGNQFAALDGVRHRLGGTFNRLYRQRNIVLHGGRLDSIATSASIRMAPSLVAAVFDRILIVSNHRSPGSRKTPLELAALAHGRLEDLRNTRSERLARLLD